MIGYGKRLDDVIPAGKFGDGEDVEVRTRMGNIISQGVVQSVTPFGLVVKENTGSIRFFSERVYLFASLVDEPPTIVANQLNDMSLDSRIEAKLRGIDEAGDPTPAETGAKPIDPNAKDDEYTDKDGKKDVDTKTKDDEKEKEEKPEKKDGAVADPSSSIDTDNLPDDVKQSIVKTQDMDESQLNGVLSDISGAAMKALKRTSVSETELYGIVQKINDASYKVLTGKAPPKRKG